MQRSTSLAQIADTRLWDIVVIGGGATGLATALDAATRGYRCILLEANDFCEGTSSRSTKLIHGGVRYLRGGEISLVKESLEERGNLLRNAPNLVKPLPFIVPAYKKWERLYYGAGLTLYDMLSGRLGIGSTQHLDAEKTLAACPNLNANNLAGSTYYWDAQFDDSRLAIAMAKTAHEHGAALLNHCPVTALVKPAGKITGVIAQDKITGAEIELKTRSVVNATGIFSDSIRQMDDPSTKPMMTPSQGIHLVLDKSFLGGQTGIMIPSTDDGRVLFAIPWLGRTLLGTTDTAGVAPEINPMPRKDEVAYLLEHTARYLTKAPQHSDIKAAFAGLRPLVTPPDGASAKSSKISRKHALMVSDSGLVTITGGKWTTCRSMADATVYKAIAVGGMPPEYCRTKDLKLLDEPTPKSSNPAQNELIDPDLPYTAADLLAGVQDEMAETLPDLLARRTRCMHIDARATLRCLPSIAQSFAQMKGCDDNWVKKAVQDVTSEIEDCIQVS